MSANGHADVEADDYEATALEVYVSIRGYVMKTHHEGADVTWARGARFVMDRADAALREAGIPLPDIEGAPSTIDVAPTTVGGSE